MSEFREMLKRRAWDEENSFRSAIGDSPHKDRLVDCRNDILDLDYDGSDFTFIFHSFRFDVGDGYSLDFSSMTHDDQPMRISVETAVKVLDAILCLVPQMKDKVEIEVDNYLWYIDTSSDLFKNRPPGNCYTWRGSFDEISRDIIGEFDGKPISRIRYYSFFDAPVEPEFYSVPFDLIHVLFPQVPSKSDFEWLSGIRPILDSLSKLVENDLFHFVLWKDDAVTPETKA